MGPVVGRRVVGQPVVGQRLGQRAQVETALPRRRRLVGLLQREVDAQDEDAPPLRCFLRVGGRTADQSQARDE
jgi:hypothetical protein